MPLRNILKRKDKLDPQPPPRDANAPGFTFIRTTTTTEEVISPPLYPGDAPPVPSPTPSQRPKSSQSPQRSQRHHGLFQRSLHNNDDGSGVSRSLSDRLHLGSRHRSASSSSVNLPANLPAEPSQLGKGLENEAEWEQRATILAKGTSPSRSASPVGFQQHGISDAPSDVRLELGKF
jgi:hypothetical protein